MDEAEADDAGVDVAAARVAPAEPGDEGGEDEGHEDHELDVVRVLEAHDRVLGEVRDVRDTRAAAGLDEHPADVAVPEALVRVVRVEVGVGVAMVCAMAA